MAGRWLDALLSGIALGMSMLPEEFPLVLTVFMVMGAWRISRARVLTRRVAAIETLGAATVLCTDKTGTLTQNRMTIVALRAANDYWRQGNKGPFDGTFAMLLVFGFSPARAILSIPWRRRFMYWAPNACRRITRSTVAALSNGNMGCGRIFSPSPMCMKRLELLRADCRRQRRARSHCGALPAGGTRSGGATPRRRRNGPGGHARARRCACIST